MTFISKSVLFRRWWNLWRFTFEIIVRKIPAFLYPLPITDLDSALSSWRHRVDTRRGKQFMPLRACVHRLLISHMTMPLPPTRVWTKYLRQQKPYPARTAAPFTVLFSDANRRFDGDGRVIHTHFYAKVVRLKTKWREAQMLLTKISSWVGWFLIRRFVCNKKTF